MTLRFIAEIVRRDAADTFPLQMMAYKEQRPKKKRTKTEKEKNKDRERKEQRLRNERTKGEN